MHRFSVTLSFAPKRSSDRTEQKVLSDERLGAKLRVTENRCFLFDSFTYIYIYIYIRSNLFSYLNFNTNRSKTTTAKQTKFV